jgi:uncharacterized protein (TIGR01777 family)
LRVLIAGGTGFLGSALRRALVAAGHEVQVLTRRQPASGDEIRWDGVSSEGWMPALEGSDAVVNVAGYGLEHWPWTSRQKKRFIDSRVQPGKALVAAIAAARHKPAAFVQISGINYYGARGEGVADESAPPAEDFLAQLTVQWEEATRPVEQHGVRRAVARSAVVLDSRGGLFPLMALPVRLWAGGPLGDGKQAVPWIHIRDEIEALEFLLENGQARGAFNLIAPEPTSNAEFMRAVARATKRPYWLPAPAFALRAVLGEMSTLVLGGRFSTPRRLLELGFRFQYPTIDAALGNLLRGAGVS